MKKSELRKRIREQLRKIELMHETNSVSLKLIKENKDLRQTLSVVSNKLNEINCTLDAYKKIHKDTLEKHQKVLEHDRKSKADLAKANEKLKVYKKQHKILLFKYRSVFLLLKKIRNDKIN